MRIKAPVLSTETQQSRDSASRIVDAAEKLFASQGFRATTTQQIAAAAGRNAALVQYYFTSKEALYKAVLRRAVEGFIHAVGAGIPESAAPEDAIRALVAAQLRALRARPHLLSLMVREMTDWGARHAEDAIHLIAASVFERVCGIIEAGQQSGVFRAEIDPRFAAISIVAQMNWVFVARPAVGVLMGRGLGKLQDNDLDAFARHAGDFVIAALRTSPSPQPVPR
jgi:AcrR family transcriptional regulator